MISFRPVRRSWSAVLAGVLAGVCVASLNGLATRTPADAAPREETAPSQARDSGFYIVQMEDLPVASYRGGVAGYRATKAPAGRKINPLSTEVLRYVAYLRGRHDAALANVGGRKAYDYVYAYNGFAARLTAPEARKLRSVPGVVAVTEDEIRQLDTSSTPSFLGLSGSDGFWSTERAKGEDVVIGIVDSGVWPESRSFSDRTDTNGNLTKDGKRGYTQLPGWNGRCVPGEKFTAASCNQKLIGAQFFNAGFGGNAGVKAAFPYEFNSPRDADGHGTHTASTAGGNQNVTASGPASAFGSVSGMAPRARIAAYKVCWGNNGEGGCAGVDSVAAIDQAVADGVDVINFSISGTSTNFLDPVEVAFLFAADAGVFVAASAGNSGPAPSTVAHPSPWITTVAAGTHNRNGQGQVTLGNGATYTGASVATPLAPTPLVNATAAALPGADPTQVALCFGQSDGGAVLDPAKVAGTIVICDRGTTGRTQKSLAVKEAGGLGMVLVNTSTNSLNADFHNVPTVHLQSTDRAAVKAYATTAGATASIGASTVLYNTPAPFTASFSSRGPLVAGGGDLLKPDIIAPGQDILAAVSPVGYQGREFDLLSGTSMSGPHIAGIAALFKQRFPTWSPMAIKSALMTSATDVLDGPNTDSKVIFRQGAGHVAPSRAAHTPVVYDSGFNDWLGFLCGTGQLTASYCPSIIIDPSNLNIASIAIGGLAGAQTVTRTMKNVSDQTLSLTPSVTGMVGVNVDVSPAMLSSPPGASRAYSVTFRRTTAASAVYTGGQLTWSGGAMTSRVPLVVQPVALAAPAEITATATGRSYQVQFGYTGSFTATARGLVPAAVTAGTVSQDPDQTFSPGDPTGTVAVTVEVPAGTTHARFSLFDTDVAPGSDIDLYVYRGATAVGASGSGGSDEQVDLRNPPAGQYVVYVHGWGLPSGTSPFRLNSWTLGDAAAGNMTVTAPATAETGTTGTISLTFSDLAPGTKYLGSVVYGGAGGLPNPTLVRVDG